MIPDPHDINHQDDLDVFEVIMVELCHLSKPEWTLDLGGHTWEQLNDLESQNYCVYLYDTDNPE